MNQELEPDLSIEDRASIKVLNRASEQILADIGRIVSSPERQNQCARCKLVTPILLPQAPNVCSAKVSIRFDAPKFVHTIDIFVEDYVTIWSTTQAKVFRSREPIELVRVEKIIDELELDGAERGWLLKGPLPTEFCSMFTQLKHSFRMVIRYEGENVSQFNWLIFVAPAELIQPAAKTQDFEDDTAISAPPAYSE